VVLHVRRSADRLLKHLREVGEGGALWHGIAHAFNGSDVQAQAFVRLGFKLGFGGAVTFERANQLRHLVQTLPLDAIVLETDAPDMPPHWLYNTVQQREAGVAQGLNSPEQIPAIAEVVAALRTMTLADLAQTTTRNAIDALPRLQSLLG
jgi:TatD DNase family protein